MEREMLLSCAGRVIEQELGLYFPQERFDDLERGLNKAANEFGFSELKKFIYWLTKNQLSRGQIENLAMHLTVCETFFFRDPEIFAALEEEILPALIAERRKTQKKLKLWSAACSSGEEAFSLGILLHRLLPDLADWQIRILATDINKKQLDKAMAAKYGEWSFRGAPEWIKERYFRQSENGFLLDDKIRQMVSFFSLNLMQDIYPDREKELFDVDIVFCRNVLMYFSPIQAKTVIKKMQSCIIDGGWIITNPIESAEELRDCFCGTSNYSPALRKKCVTQGNDDVIASAFEKSGILEIEQERLMAFAEKAELTLAREKKAPEQSLEIRGKVRQLADCGKLAEALECCEQAMTENRLNLELQYLAAMILLETKRLEEAAAALQRVIYIEPDFVMAHFYLGCIYQQQSRIAEGKHALANVRELLQNRRHDDPVEEGEGINAGSLLEIVAGMLQSEESG